MKNVNLMTCLFLSIFLFVNIILCKHNKTSYENYSKIHKNKVPITFNKNDNNKFFTIINNEIQRNLENPITKSNINEISATFKGSVETIKKRHKRIDVVFLIDSSSSVGKHNFISEIKFVKKLLSDFNVSYNYTRVAVVTFSSPRKVIRHVDQISSPSTENDKCKLLNDDILKIKFTGGGTFTYGALREARNIFTASRSPSKKFIFLVTDGFSNGRDPVPIARKLKRNNITIFSIGIQSGNYEELYNISSAPQDKHTFLLDSFVQFESLARKALHADYRSGSNIKLDNSSRCDGLCYDKATLKNLTFIRKSCCDQNADCTCGASSGHYACLCQPGYYGTGLQNGCDMCPNGTYWQSSRFCRPCPDISHITIRHPAFHISDCVCKTGFRKTKENRCEGIRCPKLYPPENGYFVKQTAACPNVMNAACGVRCKSGYQLTGTSLRLCQSNGIWSGTKVSCVLKTCPPLLIPYYGLVVCKNKDLDLFYDYNTRNETFMKYYEDDSKRVTEAMPIDTDCAYKCGIGYYLVGSRNRNCLPLSKWDGLQTTCKQVLCSPLPTPVYGEYEFSECTQHKLPYSSNCTLLCPPGFIVRGPETKTCSGRKVGVWTNKNKNQRCIDETPPKIICPKDYKITTDPNNRFARIKSIRRPLYFNDSSGHNVTYWSKPSFNRTRGVKLKIGIHRFSYEAVDTFNNKAFCYFNIIVIDKTPPMIENCYNADNVFVTKFPYDIEDNSLIDWEEPFFYDNSKTQVKIRRIADRPMNGPGIYKVTYIGTDLYNNTNNCTINVNIRGKICSPIISPPNGLSICATNISHTICEIGCNEGFAILDENNGNYVDSLRVTCSNEYPQWDMISVPECARLDVTDNLDQLITISLESENIICDNGTIQNEMQRLFEDYVKKYLCNELENCTVLSELPSCSDEGEIPEDNSRDTTYYKVVKRELKPTSSKPRRKNKRSNVRIKLLARIGKKLGIWNKGLPLSENVRIVKEELKTLDHNEPLRKMLEDMKIDLRKLKLDNTLLCPAGSIPKKYLCVKCPRGAYHIAGTNRCELCPIGKYNTVAGQIECSSCPVNHSTRKAGRRLFEDCKMQCPPGTAAKLKILRRKSRPELINKKSLMPFCRKCSTGEFQNQYDQIDCEPCPQNHTSPRGSASKSNCKLNQVDACQLTPNACGDYGTCISDTLSNYLYDCECINGFVGSHCEYKLDQCASAPCYNNGVCYYVNATEIACKCSSGFTGRFCDQFINPCQFDTCRNGGTCIEIDDYLVCECAPGYEGKFCERSISLCTPNPCETGKCIATEDGFKCQCPPGIIGKRCHLRPCDYLPCHENAICVDLKHYPATKNSYMCKCPKGLKGFNCSIIQSPCDVKPCRNNGICTPKAIRELNATSSLLMVSFGIDDFKYSEYTCSCMPFFYGKNCDIFTTPDFILTFKKSSVANYVELKGPENYLKEISFCSWIKTDDGFNYGTVLSYATETFDNMFTFTDYNGFVLYVYGNHIVTDMVINDGNWHFVCVTWSSEKGFYEIYLDSDLKYTGFNLSTGHLIEPNGVFIIGQEQDNLGSDFSESESFVGSIGYLDIWNKFISAADVREYYTSCEPYQGSLYSWTDVKSQIKGAVEITPSKFCKPCTQNLTFYNGVVQIIGHTAYYKCNIGFSLVGNSIRNCLRTSEWWPQPPLCQIVSCNRLPPISNGYILYNGDTYNSIATYLCNKAYYLEGDGRRKCLSNGHWSNNEPECKSAINCKAFDGTTNGTLSYVNEKGTIEMDLPTYPLGTIVEIKCFGDDDSSNSFLICDDHGFWDGLYPWCLEYIQITSTTLHEQYSKKDFIEVTTTSPVYPVDIQEKLTTLAPSVLENKIYAEMPTERPFINNINQSIINFDHMEYADKSFWLEIEAYLFYGCNTNSTKKSFFCTFTNDFNNYTDLSHFQLPDSSELQNIDVKLLELLTKNSNSLELLEKDLSLASFLNILLYGEKKPNNQIRIPTELENAMRFIFCFYIDAIVWDNDPQKPPEIDNSPDNTSSKLKSFIVKYSRPFFNIYKIQKSKIINAIDSELVTENLNNSYDHKILQSDSGSLKTTPQPIKNELLTTVQCNLRLAQDPPDNGIFVSISSPDGKRDYLDIQGAKKLSIHLSVGSQVWYSCKNDYVLMGKEVSMCGPDGEWSKIDYQCKSIWCESPPKLFNMHYSPKKDKINKKYKLGDKLELLCNEGYTVHGKTEIQCLQTGKWTKVQARCTKISCNNPIIPEGADILEGYLYLFKDRVKIECLNGDIVEIQCLNDGNWHPNKIC